MKIRSLACVGWMLAGAACGGVHSPAAGPARSPTVEAKPVNVEATVVTPREALAIGDLYDRGRWHFEAGNYERAARIFRRVVEAEPDGKLAPRALFEAARGWLAAGQLHAAQRVHEELVRRFPEHALAPRSLARLVKLLCYEERFEAAARWARSALERQAELAPTELVVAHAALGLALLAKEPPASVDHRLPGYEPRRRQLQRAELALERGRSVIEDHRLDRAGSFPPELALLYYGLGELRRQRAAAIRFNPFPKSFGQALEQRCQLILDAQAAYSESMRAKDPQWAAMAGFRTAQLYERLHGELMNVPPPDTTPLKRQLFEGALRLRYTLLLDKARIMLTHTLAMAERTGLAGAPKADAAAAGERPEGSEARSSLADGGQGAAAATENPAATPGAKGPGRRPAHRPAHRRNWVAMSRRALHRVKQAKQREQAAIDRLPLTRAQLRKELEALTGG